MKIKLLLLIGIGMVSIASSYASNINQIVEILRGAKIIAQDGEATYLGTFANEYSSESIFNEYSKYGSEYSSTSIWNEYSKFGGEYSQYSPFNEYSRKPPMIVKEGKIIAYISLNTYINGAISPLIIKGIADYF